MYRVAAALALLLVPVAVSPYDTPQIPEIHVSTQLVRVDVIVRDKNGPVTGLTKDDFTVFDRGKPQPISIFSISAAASASEPAEAALSAKLLPPDTFSNLELDGVAEPRSVTVVLLDNLNTLYGPAAPDKTLDPEEDAPFWVEDHALANAKAHLIEFVEKLDPRDRIAIYGLRNSLRVLCDFTSDRTELLAILRNYDTTSITSRREAEPGKSRDMASATSPQGAAGHMNDFGDRSAQDMANLTNAIRAGKTMEALESIADHLASIPGRKNLVWLTANLPFSGAELARILSPARIAAYPIDARGLLARAVPSHGGSAAQFGQQNRDDLREAVYGAAAPPAQSLQPIGIPAMDELAADTGGQAFVNTNDITGAIRDAVEDSAVTYTLGFYIERDSLDGKFHPLRVEVSRKDASVRCAKGYFAYSESAASNDQNARNVMTALQSPLESSAIPLQVTVARESPPQPNSLDLSFSIDIHNLELVQSGNLRTGEVAVDVIQEDATGKLLQKWGRKFSLRLTDTQYRAFLNSGMPFRQDVPFAAGVATVRVLVEDLATGEIGSLIIPLSEIR